MCTFLRALLALFLLSWQVSATASEPAPVPRPAAPAGCSAINYADEDDSINFLRMLYQEERFGDLDAILGCLMTDARELSSGKPASALAYQVFRREMRAPGATQADLQRVERWAQQRPPSMFAELAALRLRYAFSWNVRGGAPASKVGEERLRAFHQGLADTEAALHRATPELRDTALWHQLRLAMAGDTTLARGDMASAFEAAVRRWPTNYDLHEVRLTRMVPRWGGSWEHVDAFIQHFADKHKAEQRDALYARLYANLLLTMGDDPRQTRMDWPRMKRGLEALVTLYPDPRHMNMAASFACFHQDAAYFKTAMARLPRERNRPSAWLRGTDSQSCAF